MSTNLFKVYRSGANTFRSRVAPAPSGGVYVAVGGKGGDGVITVDMLRLSSGGSIVWDKELSHDVVGYEYIGVIFPILASNATHVAVAVLTAITGGTIGTAYLLYDSDGDLVWQTFLPLMNGLDDGGSVKAQHRAGNLILAADNTVYHFTGGDGSDEAIIVKLDGSDGSLTWAANMRKSSESTGVDWTGSMSQLSGGDLVVHTRDSTKCYVQRLSDTDGSVSWSKGIVWTSAQLDAGVCVDPSDNIYVVGRPHTSTNKVLPVVKLDSSGASVWNRNIVCPAGLSSLGLDFKWSGGLTADSAGLYVPTFFAGASTKYVGHTFVPQDGTVATGTALLATFPSLSADGWGSEVYSAAHSGGPSVFAYRDQTAPATGYVYGVVVKAGSDASEDGTWGSYARVTRAYDVASGGATVSTQTYTRASTPTVTATAFTIVEGAGTLLVESYSPTYPATSLGPTALFGTPRLFGVVSQEAYTVTTGFGTPILSDDVFATSAGPFTAFGTAVYSDDRSVTAAGLAAGTAFGLAWAERDPLPGSPTTVAAAPSTAFGTPAVNGAAAVTAAGASTTAFGTPVSGWVCPVTGFAVGAFGTPTLSNPVRATSLAPATAFGLGMTAGFGGTTGAAPSTAFGLPVATFGAVGNVTGTTSTAFGTPSTLNNRQRTRSGVFRTQWGVAQAERTAP